VRTKTSDPDSFKRAGIALLPSVLESALRTQERLCLCPAVECVASGSLVGSGEAIPWNQILARDKLPCMRAGLANAVVSFTNSSTHDSCATPTRRVQRRMHVMICLSLAGPSTFTSQVMLAYSSHFMAIAYAKGRTLQGQTPSQSETSSPPNRAIASPPQIPAVPFNLQNRLSRLFTCCFSPIQEADKHMSLVDNSAMPVLALRSGPSAGVHSKTTQIPGLCCHPNSKSVTLAGSVKEILRDQDAQFRPYYLGVGELGM